MNMPKNNQPKFKIGIVDGLCLGLAIFFLILLIAGIVYDQIGGNAGAHNNTTAVALMATGGAGAALFIIIFLIYEIVAVVKIRKAKNVLMLGAAPEQKRAPKALGAGRPQPGKPIK